ncbi:hypothetical protein PsYK624_154690 [Phanerochaete sordida]|uniref:Uncharacterized protein n=1 Tax=Phanerochaete sordida TaxID=48140 RepID=A0A9P3LM00_9APHY|nr:hypothetical protein PsYK624_154690 [Phanerochaete sordida]
MTTPPSLTNPESPRRATQARDVFPSRFKSCVGHPDPEDGRRAGAQEAEHTLTVDRNVSIRGRDGSTSTKRQHVLAGSDLARG